MFVSLFKVKRFKYSSTLNEMENILKTTRMTMNNTMINYHCLFPFKEYRAFPSLFAYLNDKEYITEKAYKNKMLIFKVKQSNVCEIILKHIESLVLQKIFSVSREFVKVPLGEEMSTFSNKSILNLKNMKRYFVLP